MLVEKHFEQVYSNGYNYKFKNKKLFDLAMTHISLANDLHIESNQRLEFLG